MGAYIIFSKKLNRFYIGSTTDMKQRLINHNNHKYGVNKFTAKANDWALFLFIPTLNYSHALRIEKKIKSQKSSTYIKKLKKIPGIT